MIEQIPRWVIVLGVLILASLTIILLDPPHSPCQSQIKIVKDKLKGRLFPGKAKKAELPPAYVAQMENCKFTNSPGGCYELFKTMRMVNRELLNLEFTCNDYMGEVTEIRQSLRAVMKLMTEIAWGEEPPQPVDPSRAWLEAADLSLFCHMKDLFVRYYGKEELDLFIDRVFAELPGEAPVFEGTTCANCDFRKVAKDILSKEEIWARSLFAVRCDVYR